MKLYYSPGACSLSPHIALREAGIDAELAKVDTKTHTLADGSDYYAINAKGYVPTLELDDGQRLTEGPAIVQYIADRNPAAGLAPPAGTLERYRLQEWLNFITSELHKQFSPLFATDTPADYRTITRQRIAKRLDWLAGELGDQDYLLGDCLTVADGYLFTILNWTEFVAIDLGNWPVLAAYQARIAARPKVREAMIAEGLVKTAEKRAA
ncbi:MAG TPA: glutathione transferase GstA [Casimicrobiaceae bacterium]|jgi:glutathione S-transferase|nr:glutathione transferase GstA [Casimicrobiaceae bacterium]